MVIQASSRTAPSYKGGDVLVFSASTPGCRLLSAESLGSVRITLQRNVCWREIRWNGW